MQTFTDRLFVVAWGRRSGRLSAEEVLVDSAFAVGASDSDRLYGLGHALDMGFWHPD